jgi:hypothetical protein
VGGCGAVPLTQDQAANVVAAARDLVGTPPYSLLDYASLALLHTGIERAAVRERVESSGQMVCSQLVDET